MNILKRFLGQQKARPARGLEDPNHPARQQIDRASAIADQAVEIQVVGDGTIISSNTAAGMEIVAAIDAALEKAPGDLDLLVAKSGALYYAMQFKSAEEVIDQVLAVDPQHFEARMRKDHWADWPNLFTYPSWSEKATVLHPWMAAQVQANRPVQIVRDGLQTGIAIVRGMRRQDFPQGLSPQMRSKWEPVWSETPYGAVVAHYTLIEDNPADPLKAEAILPTFVPSEMTPASGYWLLHRLNALRSCFIVITEGSQVLYNKRYMLPDSTRKTLRSIVEKITQRAAGPDLLAFQRAQQWHMQNFDMARVHF